jgi:hypothetical protein
MHSTEHHEHLPHAQYRPLLQGLAQRSILLDFIGAADVLGYLRDGLEAARIALSE